MTIHKIDTTLHAPITSHENALSIHKIDITLHSPIKSHEILRFSVRVCDFYHWRKGIFACSFKRSNIKLTNQPTIINIMSGRNARLVLRFEILVKLT